MPKRQPGPRPEPRSFYSRPDPENVKPELAATSPEDAVEDESGALNFTRGVTAHEVRLLLHIAAQLQIRFPDGAPDFSEEQYRQISGRMVVAYPTNWTIPEIGPAFDTKSLAEYWEVPRSKVLRRVAAGTVFAIKVKGRYLYPEFQFDPVGRVIWDLLDLVALVRAAFDDDLQVAKWLGTWPTEPSPAHLVATGRQDEAFELALALIAHGKSNAGQKGSAQ